LESTQDPSDTPLEACVICDSQATKRKFETPFFKLGSIFYLDTVYHKLDFIYLLNEQDEDAPYEIAQILDFTQNDSSSTLLLQIRRLKHYDDFAARHGLDSFTKANCKKDEVCDHNFEYFSNL
jgi:hypothetical protein